jgi:DNA polymerase-4
MELRHNPEPAEIMHIDLNSAFAMTEQQANPLLRHRPVGVTNRLSDYAITIASSHEARQLGITLGVRNGLAKRISPQFVMLESDPAKYQYVHRRLRELFASYAPSTFMKSVDEGIIDFRGMRGVLGGQSLEDIGREIKARIRDEIGDYMSVNVGIGQNRWLAKIAAGFMKPDGLYTIDANNVEVVYSMLGLTDLPYIKRRNARRLHEVGIETTIDFYRARETVLTRQVFKSINGHLWYLKLRGYETEMEPGIRTVSRSYVLEHRTADPREMSLLLYKACVKLSRRLHTNHLAARGLLLYLGYEGVPVYNSWRHSRSPRWRERQMHTVAAWRADQLYERALELFAASPQGQVVTSLFITAYHLEPVRSEQPALFDDDYTRRNRLELAINAVNDKYGDHTVQPAAVAASKNPMKDKIPFGSIRYFT